MFDGDLSENCAKYLKMSFKASAMNICQTQPLSMMKVDKMTVEFKEGLKGMKAKKTSRVIPVPLAMREQTKKIWTAPSKWESWKTCRGKPTTTYG